MPNESWQEIYKVNMKKEIQKNSNKFGNTNINEMLVLSNIKIAYKATIIKYVWY